MPSRPDRIRVWRGEIKRTKGGLVKADLMKNKSGKIVSRRRSAAAKGNSNLGEWLRAKGQKFTDLPRPYLKKKDAKKAVPVPKKAVPVPKKASPKKKKPVQAPKKKPVQAPKKKRDVISLIDDDDDLAAPVQQPSVAPKRDKVAVSNIRGGKRKRYPTVKPTVSLEDEYAYLFD